jgi:hypothetical protein
MRVSGVLENAQYGKFQVERLVSLLQIQGKCRCAIVNYAQWHLTQ